MTMVDLDQRARVIRNKLGQLHGLSRRSASLAVEIGRDLIACKRAVSAAGDKWLKWLAKHRISADIAERLMALAKWAKANPTEFRKLRNRVPVTMLYRIGRYGLDEVEKLLRRLESGELQPGTKAAATLNQRISGLSRRRKKPEAEAEEPQQEQPKSEQEPAPASQPEQPPPAAEPQPLAASAEPTNGHDAAAAEPQAAAPHGSDAAAAFFVAFADLLATHPPPDNVRALAKAFRDQIRISADDIQDIVDLLQRLIRQLRDEVTSGRPH